MTEPTEEVIDRFSRDRALGATGLLAAFNVPGVLTAADVHVALRLGRVVEESSPSVLLATALVTRAVRQGSIRLDLATVADQPIELPAGVTLPWPDPVTWLADVAGSALVAEQVLRVEGPAVYLDRYWREEIQVSTDLRALIGRQVEEFPAPALQASALRVLPVATFVDQREAAVRAAGNALTVLTGGPGTGKTTTVAALLAIFCEQFEASHERLPRIALAAPTGKAASRLKESVIETLDEPTNGFDDEDRRRIGTVEASTLHRLLGWIPDSSVRFKHHRGRPLPFDLVVVDEASMVSLSMMARLLEALPDRARLVLVGDADQLASVEAGAVLADVVRGLETRAAALRDDGAPGAPGAPSQVVRLTVTHRYGGGIAALADALRRDDPDDVLAVLADESADRAVWIRPDDEPAMATFLDDVVRRALEVRLPAERGEATAAVAALDKHRLLCAHRNGPYGVNGWNHDVEQRIAERTGVHHYDEWYPGRPVLVTANDRSLGLYNGDTGVAVKLDQDGQSLLRVAIPGQDGLRFFAPTRLPEVQTVHALTVHKAQGSQAEVISVIVPPLESPLLTWELFYTAVTRAQKLVRIVGSEAAIRAAVGRRIQRPSGLAERLAAPGQ